MDLQQTLHDVAAAVGPLLGMHPPADYIPGLASVDPGQFGICVANCSGAVFGAGQWNTPFSIQSISKVFTLALVLKEDGEALWQRVYRNHPEAPSTHSSSSNTTPASPGTHSSTQAPSS